MYSNLTKNIEKIFSAFNKIERFPKAIIKYGIITFFIIFAVGSTLFALNCSILDFRIYIDFIAKTIIKSSFTILAEVIIGGLLIDYIIKK